MYNYFMFVGRLAKEPDIVNFDDGKKVVNILEVLMKVEKMDLKRFLEQNIKCR